MYLLLFSQYLFFHARYFFEVFFFLFLASAFLLYDWFTFEIRFVSRKFPPKSYGNECAGWHIILGLQLLLDVSESCDQSSALGFSFYTFLKFVVVCFCEYLQKVRA